MAAALTASVVGAALTNGAAALAGSDLTTCGYAKSGPPGPRGNYLQIQQSPSRPAVTISRSGRRLVVDERSPLDCTGPVPTVDNIDRIFLLSDGMRKLSLDMRNGGLGPGASEKGAGAEIEVFVRVSGSAGRQGAQLTLLAGGAPNVVTFGRAAGSEQFNLNARRERLDDTDVYVESVDYSRSTFHTGLAGGDNTVDGRGPGRLRPSGFSGIFHMGPGANRIFGPLGESHLHTSGGPDLLVGGPSTDSIIGAAGRDRLIGGGGDDRLSPGSGRDTVDAGGGDDQISTSDDQVDRIDCGPGEDRVRGAGPEDTVRNCESLL